MEMKAIITGSTGMVGKSVLLECLDHPAVEEVLVINRRSLGMNHPKLKEIILKDFTDSSSIMAHLKGYDACFFCLGVSAFGLNEEQYSQITYDITAHFADMMFELNPNMVFNYASASGADSSEKGRIMWARVKGRTENYLLSKGFRDAYMFRPGLIIPEKGIRSATRLYNFLYTLLWPFFFLIKGMKNVTTTTKIGQAMVNSVLTGDPLKHLRNKDINALVEND